MKLCINLKHELKFQYYIAQKLKHCQLARKICNVGNETFRTLSAAILEKRDLLIIQLFLILVFEEFNH